MIACVRASGRACVYYLVLLFVSVCVGGCVLYGLVVCMCVYVRACA